MSIRKKNLLIPEEKFKSDFAPLSGFYNYHIKGKDISIALDEIQGFGVSLKAHKLKNIANITDSSLPVNSIAFSSSKKKNNVKNLTWAIIRCLVAHPENIIEKDVNGTMCYSICCCAKNSKTGKRVPTMKGLVACEIWPKFTEQLINKIAEKEI